MLIIGIWTLTLPNMAQRFGLCLACVVVVASSRSVAPGANAGLYGDAVAHSDYTLNLQPPEENTYDVEASMDAIMKAEDEIAEDMKANTAMQKLTVEKVRQKPSSRSMPTKRPMKS